MTQAFEYERLARSLVLIELQEASQPADSPAIGIGGVQSEAVNGRLLHSRLLSVSPLTPRDPF